jgi:hypothetical protein
MGFEPMNTDFADLDQAFCAICLSLYVFVINTIAILVQPVQHPSKQALAAIATVAAGYA